VRDHGFLGFRSGTAVVTGAASGIGRAVVEDLLHVGVNVAAWDVLPEGLDDLRHDLSTYDDHLWLYCIDVASREGVSATFHRGGAGRGSDRPTREQRRPAICD
jgi:NAD(P)-dependent dehydrogenase (short-subunit alcohol dehydrogenase family)